VTIAEALKQQGYRTMAIGKWHLGHRDEYLPTNHGFDGYLGVPYSNDLARPDSMPNPYMHGPPLPLIRDTTVVDQPVDQATLTERYTNEALEFISSDREEPFFLYLPYTMPHVPLHTSPRFRGTSKAGLYGDVVRGLDWSVGQILETLREKGLDENTLVVFTSDNGPFLNVGAKGFAYPEQVKSWHHGSAGLLRSGKFTQYEGGFRVPAIAWWPGEISAGQTCSELVTAMDLFPTFINVAGGEIPRDRTIDGNDVMPVLENCSPSPTDEFFYLNHGKERFAGVRKGPWKLLISDLARSEEEAPVELYNLFVDPAEHHNVASKHQEIVRRLQDRLEGFENKIGTRP
jgi:arylsulfatase A-like enzyme